MFCGHLSFTTLGFLLWLCVVIAVFVWSLQKLLHLSWYNNYGECIVVCGLVAQFVFLLKTCGDEKALYLFFTLCNISFTAWWPGSWCVSVRPSSIFSLKMFLSWTPVFLIPFVRIHYSWGGFQLDVTDTGQMFTSNNNFSMWMARGWISEFAYEHNQM